jgi:hypothetical protein
VTADTGAVWADDSEVGSVAELVALLTVRVTPLFAPERPLVAAETVPVTPEMGPADEADETGEGGSAGGAEGAAPDEDCPPAAVPVTGAVAEPSALVTAPTTDPAEPVTESAETADVTRPGAGRSSMVAA